MGRRRLSWKHGRISRFLALFLSFSLLPIFPVFAASSADFKASVGKVLHLELYKGDDVLGVLEKVESGRLFLTSKSGPQEVEALNVRAAFVVKVDAETFAKMPSAPAPTAMDQETWRRELLGARVARGLSFGFGIPLLLGGGGLAVAEALSSGAPTSTSNSIQSIGALTGAVGLILVFVGFGESGKVHQLMDSGKQQGYAWDVQWEGKKGARVAARVFFGGKS